VNRPTDSQANCLPPLRSSFSMPQGAASSRMRALRSPSMRRSIHRKISV